MTLFGIFTITSLLWNLLSYRAGSNTGQAALHQHRRFAQPRWSAQRPLPYSLDYLRLRALLVRLCETPEALSEYSLTCSAKCIRSQAPSVTFYLKHKGEVWRAQQTSSPFRPFNQAKCACGQIILKTGFSPFLWMGKTVEVKMINIQSVQCVRDWTQQFKRIMLDWRISRTADSPADPKREERGARQCGFPRTEFAVQIDAQPCEAASMIQGGECLREALAQAFSRGELR